MAWWRRLLRDGEKSEAQVDGPRATAPDEGQEGSPYRRAAAMPPPPKPVARPWLPPETLQRLQELQSYQPTLIEDGGDEEEFLFYGLRVHDPNEVPFAAAFIHGTAQPAQLAAYHDYLLSRGDARGRVLALLSELRKEPPPRDAEQKRAELRELAPRQWRAWMNLVTHHLLNCGRARDCHGAIRFSFQCPRTWEDLEPTDQRSVRHCSGCSEDVHFAETVAAAEQLALQGKCVSVPKELAMKGGYPNGQPVVTGRLEHPIAAWSHRLFGRFSNEDYEQADRLQQELRPPKE